MLKNNKLKAVMSSVLILLPMLYGIIMWNDLPDVLTTHFGADGNADGFGTKAFAVFALPCILLVMQWLCLIVTSLDKRQKEQNKKALGMIFWIVPIITLVVSAIMYSVALGREVDVMFFVPLLLGFMLIFAGNYLPKVKQNSTLGIKIYFTLTNEENWNKTHRFCGKLWFFCGFVMLSAAVFPLKVSVFVMMCVIAVIVIFPFVYSYLIYRRHKKEGIEYVSTPKSNAEKAAGKFCSVAVTLIVIGIFIMMFTGEIYVSADDASLKIEATYWTDLDVDCSEIDTIEYRKDLDVGIRTNGFCSPRLSMGIFQNDEFGSYTLYSYTNAVKYVVLTSNGKTLVIGLNDSEYLTEIYNKISEKIK